MRKVFIHADDFDAHELYHQLRVASPEAGAIVQFTGLVRADLVPRSTMSTAGTDNVQSLTIEHYPGMTEKAIESIIAQCVERWGELSALVVHRIGELFAGDQIVYVAIAAEHRQAAFDAAMFIMDYLKNDVPLWKKQSTSSSSAWVEQKLNDKMRKTLWD